MQQCLTEILMKNHYHIVDYSNLGLPFVEVCGIGFHYQDLFEIIGRDQYMTTFELRSGSNSYSKFGSDVVGIIFYDFKSFRELETSCDNDIEVDQPIIRIDSPDKNITLDQKIDLKSIGINVSDIERISYLPNKKVIENYETGEKKVPNVVEVKVDLEGMDVDMLKHNYLVSKLNSGVELIHFEKEQLIGLTLALNDGQTNSNFLKYLGFDETDLKENLNIWYQLYKVKERRNLLNEEEKVSFREVKNILSMKKFTKVLKELAACGLDSSDIEKEQDIIKSIFNSVEAFTPTILMHGTKQVFWDVDSYIHIALGHLKDFQLGNFRAKTPFLYKADDIGLLIEKVLGCVESELKCHLSEKPDKNFSRHGRMGVVFNKDHYNIKVDPNGRLIQFHMVSEKVK